MGDAITFGNTENTWKDAKSDEGPSDSGVVRSPLYMAGTAASEQSLSHQRHDFHPPLIPASSDLFAPIDRTRASIFWSG